MLDRFSIQQPFGKNCQNFRKSISHIILELGSSNQNIDDLPLVLTKNPWLEIAGKYQDDPNWDEYQAAIAEARQAANESEGIWLEGDTAQ
jgi:hypothetical protein